MMPTLRPATPQDADAIASVLLESRRAFLPYAPSAHTDEAVHAWVAGHLIPHTLVTVATVAGRVVGVLAASEDETGSWIDQFYLLPGHVGNGLGSSMLSQAHAQLRRPIRLYTFQENRLARRFYERHGYSAIVFSDGSGNEERCPDVLYELGSA